MLDLRGVPWLTPVAQGLGRASLALARRLLGPDAMAHTMDAALERASGSLVVDTVIDVGASNGGWTRMARRHFPSARFLLVEAQAGPHQAALRALKADDPGVDYVLAAAGAKEGTIHFDASDPFGGSASDRPFASNDLVVPVTTVDAEVARRGLTGPYLLKLDTHGYEVPILDGATRVLERASLLVVEAYNFRLCEGALRFHELCAFLAERGFRCLDLCDPMHRPGDGVLWQMDLVFARADRPEFGRTTYA